MDSASFLHSLFPLRHLFSFLSKVTRRGYPRRKCLSSEGGACACCLFFFFSLLSPPSTTFKQGPGSYRSYVMECWSLITGCQEKLHELPYSFFANPRLLLNCLNSLGDRRRRSLSLLRFPTSASGKNAQTEGQAELNYHLISQISHAFICRSPSRGYDFWKPTK